MGGSPSGVDATLFSAGSDQTRPHKTVESNLATNVGRSHDVGNVLSKVGEKLYVDLNDNSERGITESTTGVATFQVKANLGAFQLTSEDVYGKIIFVSSIDPALTQLSASLAKQYVNYRITHLSVTVRNVSPFASASGSIQLAYINDPNNIVTMGTENIETLIRQTNSRQVGAKDTLDFDFNQNHLNVLGAPSGWKFCKPRGMPIFDRYGMIAAAVRGVPSIGDGAQFVVSVAATFEFFGMTHNVDETMRYEGLADTGLVKNKVIDDCSYATEYGNFQLSVGVPLEMPESLSQGTLYTCYFASPRNFKIEIEDSSGRIIDFPCQIRACQITYINPSHANYIFTARTQRMANLNRPYKSVKVTPLDVACTAVLTVPDENEVQELIDVYAIDSKVQNELRMFESLNKSITRRFAALYSELDTNTRRA